MKRSIICLSFAFLSFSQFSLNISGFSYHFDRQTDDGFKFNEFNPGFGIRYTHFAEKHHLFNEIGFYKDSGNFWATYINLGYQYRLLAMLYFGANLSVMRSDNLNNGNWLIGPIPLLSYRFSALTINMIYFPEIKDVNKYTALGFYFSVPMH